MLNKHDRVAVQGGGGTRAHCLARSKACEYSACMYRIITPFNEASKANPKSKIKCHRACTSAVTRVSPITLKGGGCNNHVFGLASSSSPRPLRRGMVLVSWKHFVLERCPSPEWGQSIVLLGWKKVTGVLMPTLLIVVPVV